jgi:hypothetical protein
VSCASETCRREKESKEGMTKDSRVGIHKRETQDPGQTLEDGSNQVGCVIFTNCTKASILEEGPRKRE